MGLQGMDQNEPFGQRRLAIVFAMPYFREACKSEITGRLSLWVEKLHDLDTSAYAWVFPGCARYIRGYDNSYCPGVAVLIKEVKR
jgi:hypothetical protein